MNDNTDEILDNVIKFPLNNLSAEIPTTEKELIESVSKIKDMFFDMISTELSAPVFNRASLYGFNISDDEHMKDCILVVEAIMSLLLKSKGIHHNLQDYAQEHITYDENDMIYGDDY